MRVNLGCHQVRVAEQFLDAAQICTGIEQMCGVTVSQLVRREARIQPRRRQMLLQQPFHGIRAQSPATRAWKDDAVLGSACFIKPCFEDYSDRLAQRDGALLLLP